MEIIIETDVQFIIYKEQAEKFKKAIENYDPGDLHPAIALAQIDGMTSVYNQIVEELNDYASK